MTGDRHAWIDASAGVAGDMLLGALLDAGAGLAAVRETVDAVVPGAVRLSAAPVTRAGLHAVHVDVVPLVADVPRRTWPDVRALLAALPERVRDRATAVFARLAAAEARVHGITVDEVHFHEVGALDSIADVVGVCAALEDLGVGTVSAGEVAVGAGRVRTAHGELPVPVPAVAELARGWRVRAGGTGELATPTGMAVIRALATDCEDLPSLRVEAVGAGAGRRDTPGRANVVRVVIGTRSPAAPTAAVPAADVQAADVPAAAVPAAAVPAAAVPAAAVPAAAVPAAAVPAAAVPAAVVPAAVVPAAGVRAEPAVLLEANVDDLDPRLWPEILAALLRDGAADAWLVPIVMKKGRPAHTLSVLCHPDRAAALRASIFRDTSTLGVREGAMRKYVLPRAFVDVAVAGGTVAVKLGHTGGVVVQVMPEFDDVAALARRLGRAQREVLAEAAAAAAAAGLVVGAALPENARPA